MPGLSDYVIKWQEKGEVSPDSLSFLPLLAFELVYTVYILYVDTNTLPAFRVLSITVYFI